MNFRIFTAALTLVISTSLGTLVFAQEASPIKAGDFVRQASIVNQFTIASSQLAVKQATMPEVKDFAQAMIADHTKVADTLKSTLVSSDLGISSTKQLDEMHEKTLDGLKSASSENFDNLYIQAQSDTHDEAVSLFKSYAKNGDNAALIKFASDTLPTLERHQVRINNLRQPLISDRH